MFIFLIAFFLKKNTISIALNSYQNQNNSVWLTTQTFYISKILNMEKKNDDPIEYKGLMVGAMVTFVFKTQFFFALSDVFLEEIAKACLFSSAHKENIRSHEKGAFLRHIQPRPTFCNINL